MKKTIYTNASPVFVVGDLAVAAEFYCKVLGFEKKWCWPDAASGEPAIRIGLAPAISSNMGDFEINLIEDPNIGPSGTSYIHFHVKNIEDLYAKCQSVGVDIYLELGDREWGMRDFRVSDPFGNRIGFGEVI